MWNLSELKKQCTVTDFENFNQHYTEIVNLIGLDILKEYMPCSIAILKDQYHRGNVNFNNISDRSLPYSLSKWDAKANILPVRGASLSQKVCILKQAGKMLCEE